VLVGALGFEKAPRGLELTEQSKSLLRAVAALLNSKPDTMLLVGVRAAAKAPAAEQVALSRSTAIVLLLRQLTHRDDVAEGVSFSAVAKLPGAAASGVGLGTSTVPQPKPKPKSKTKPVKVP
jgi:hypothetical protein